MVGFRDADHASEMRRQAAELMAEASRIEAAHAEAERAAREARKPKQPDVAGPVFVTFQKYQSGRVYTYAAVGWDAGRGNVRWSVTGQPMERYNWPGLLALVGEANWPTLRPLTAGEPMMAPDDAPPVVERMGRFGRVVGTDTPTGGPVSFADGPFARGPLGHVADISDYPG